MGVKPRKAKHSLPSVVIAGVIGVSPAYAETETDSLDSLLSLEEVIVTAQKRQQSIQSVPSSIAAVTAESIEKTNTTEFGDLGKITAGIVVAGPGDGFLNVMRVRGIGNNPQSPFIRPSVGVFVDEVPLLDLAAAFVNLADVERIEILKGPQATLFGKEVSSGAISIFTKRPHSENFEGDLELTLATLGDKQIRGGVNVPITDSISFRGAVFKTKRDDFSLTNVFSGEDVEFDSDGARGRILWEFNDSFTALLAYQTHSSDQKGFEQDIKVQGNGPTRLAQRRGVDLLEVDGFDRKVQTLGLISRETDFELATLTLEYETDNDWTFSSISGYQVYDATSTGDVDDIKKGGSDANVSVFNTFVVQSTFAIEGLTQELRATFEGDYLSSIIGAFYAKSSYGTDTSGLKLGQMDLPIPTIPGGTPNPADPSSFFFGDLYTSIDSITDENIEEWAIFNHNTYDITDELELTFGVRYSEVRKEKLGYDKVGAGPYGGLAGVYVDPGSDLSNYPIPGLPATATYPDAPYGQGFFFIPLANFAAGAGLPVSSVISQWNPSQQDDKWTATTGSLKIAYRINENVKAYLGIDRGFKAGGFNSQRDAVLPPGTPRTVRADPESFDSEFATNIELGLKGTFYQNTVRWNSAIYRQIFDDFQVELQDDVGIGQSIVNAAKVQVVGAETEVTWLVNEKVLLDANVAYSDASFKNFDNGECITPQYAAIACANPADADGDGYADNDAPLDLTDKRVNGTGRWSANLNGTYSDEFASGTMSWFARGELAFRDDRIDFPDLDPATKQPSYTLLNASVGVMSSDSSWEATLWVKNLTDEEYIILHNRARDDAKSAFLLPVSEGIRVTLGNERQLGLTGRYRW